MSEQGPELEAFSKFIVAMEPWLGEFVLVGGWAHRLYRLDPRARKLDYLPLTTLDGDLAVPPKLKKEESTVRKRPLAPENSLTAYAVASDRTALLLASIWWPVGFALAVAYFVFISRRYAGKVSVKRDTQGFY